MGAKISIFPIAYLHRVDNQGRVAVVIRVDLNDKPVAYDKMGPKAHKVLAEHWDAKAKQIKSASPVAKMLNVKINKRVAELEELFLRKEMTGFSLTKQSIKQLVAGVDPTKCFYTFCEKHITEKYGNKETLKQCRGEMTKLKAYTPELFFSDLTYEFLSGYKAYMRDVKGNTPNTIWKTFRVMNTLINDAIKAGGYIELNPFTIFDRGRFKQGKRTYLTSEDRAKIEQLLKQPLPKTLYDTTSYFLFMCYCGLRFRDAKAFRYDQHIIADERLIIVTHKAKEPVNIKLYPKLKNILEYVKDNPLKMTNQIFNHHLKSVGSMAGVSVTLTAHLGRHSFGRLLAENGIDIKKAQKLLGHRDKLSTEIYYHLIDKDVDNEIDSKLGLI